MTDTARTESTAATEREGLSAAPTSLARLTWGRLFHHKLAIIGAVGLMLIVAAFIIGPWYCTFGA